MGIKDLPKNERPREKALRFGLESLGPHELIGLIIGSGTRGNSALDIAHQLLETNNGIHNLSRKAYQDFLTIKGLSEISALKLGAVFELFRRLESFNPDDGGKLDSHTIFEKYRIRWMNCDQEILGIIVLNKKRRILSEKTVYIGTKYSITTSIRDIFKELLFAGGDFFYLFHNHPSDNVEPSEHDIIFTAEIIKECGRLGFTLIDHLIISYHEFYSFKEKEIVRYQPPKRD